MIRTCALITITLPATALADMGKPRPSPGQQRVMQVVNSTSLSKAQKVARLKELVGDDDTRMTALYQLIQLDSGEAMRTAHDAFRDDDTPREAKLAIGRFVLTQRRHGKKLVPKGFVAEHARYLIASILDGGRQEFCRKMHGGVMTAVGEYAFLASDFQGYKQVPFAPFKDVRVVPVLIGCLDAPDNVYSAQHGGCIRGTPGKSTGRNVARQQIPVALGKLGDRRALAPLLRVLRKHRDVYQRTNAAYAVALLQTPAENAKLVAELKVAKAINDKGRIDWAKDRYHHLYPLGRGLLDRGDDAGIELMAFKYSHYSTSKGLSETVYMLAERVSNLKNTRSAKLEGFFKQAFAHEPVMGMFMQDKTKVKFNDYGHTVYDFGRAAPRVEKLFDSMCLMIEANRLVSLRPQIDQIAKHSTSEILRKRAVQCSARLRK